MKKLSIFLLLLLPLAFLFGCEARQIRIDYILPEGADAIESVTLGEAEFESFTPDEPSLIGHKFLGWYTDEELTEPFTGGAMPDAESVTLYAAFERLSYTLFIHLDNETQSFPVEYGAAILLDPNRDSPYFKGYYKNEELTEPFTGGNMPASDLHIYTDWGFFCKLSFILDGETTTVIYDKRKSSIDSSKLPNTSRLGHTFSGWFFDEDMERPFSLSDIENTDESVTVWGGFTKNTYNLYIHKRGGYDRYSVEYGDAVSITEPADSTAYFMGFFADENCTERINDLPTEMPASDLHIYTAWRTSLTVRVNTGIKGAVTTSGGELIQTVTKASPDITPITVAACLGYKYLGYRVNGGSLIESSSVSLVGATSDSEILLVTDYYTNELPIVRVDTGGVAIQNKYDYVDMTFELENTAEEISGATGGIRFRGNSTLGYPKKPYRIKFDKKQSLFGLTSAKSWVLLADYLDPSVLHNYTAFSLAEDASFRFVPSPNKVNLYFNGEYAGIYTLCEQVQENPGRIDIEADLPENPTSIKDYNFFIALDGKVLEDNESVEGETYFYLEDYGKYFELKYPEKDAFETDEDFELFFGLLEEYVKYLMKIFTDGDLEKIRAEVDINTLIDFCLIDMIMGEKDHANNSFNMFFMTGDNAKLQFGPIWDYDWCLLTPWTGKPNVDFTIKNELHYSNVFFKAVKNSPELMALLAERYEEHFDKKLTEAIADVSSMTLAMKESLKLNAQRWYASHADPELTEKNSKFLYDYLVARQVYLRGKFIKS